MNAIVSNVLGTSDIVKLDALKDKFVAFENEFEDVKNNKILNLEKRLYELVYRRLTPI